MDIRRFDEWRERYDTMSYGSTRGFPACSQGVSATAGALGSELGDCVLSVDSRQDRRGRVYAGVGDWGFDGSLAKHVMTGTDR